MIKNFFQYIKEDYKDLPTDSSSMIQHKTEVNNLARWIGEYQQKKNLLYSIYRNFKDDNDLLTKLKAQKLVVTYETDPKIPVKVRNTNIKDPGRMKFENPLLAEVARIADKKRMLSDLEIDKDEQEKNISERESKTSGNERLRPSFQKDIETMKSKLKNISDDIKELQNEIKLLETKSKEKLTQMQKEFSLKRKILEDDIQDRRQVDTTGTK